MYLITIIVLFSLMTGCSREPKSPFSGDALPLLVDTIYAGESREVLLTNLTGGFYFDDAFRDQALGGYGYSRLEYRLVAGWEVYSAAGERLDSEPDICIVTPSRIERQYQGGLREIVEAPFRISGLHVELQRISGRGLIFRPLFDIRRLGVEDAPTYRFRQLEVEGVQILVAQRADEHTGCLAVATTDAEFFPTDAVVRIDHPRGSVIGRESVSEARAAGEFRSQKGKSVRFGIGWGGNEEGALKAALRVLNESDDWRNSRLDWQREILHRVHFRSERPELDRAFSWAALTLAGMTFRRGDESFLMTGIPYVTTPDGWWTVWSAPGLTHIYNDSLVRSMLTPILHRQWRDTSSVHYGMLPNKMFADSIEYRVPFVSGLFALNQEYMEKWESTPDTGFNDTLTIALVRDMLGSIKKRMVSGVMVSGAYDHVLWDGAAAPMREGATYETQVLFGKLREWIAANPRVPELMPDLIPALYEYRPDRGISSRVMSGPKSMVEMLADKFKTQQYVADEKDAYHLPLPTNSVLFYYHLGSDTNWTDYFPLLTDSSKTEVMLSQPHRTLRVTQILGDYWQYPGDKKWLEKSLQMAAEYELIAPVGFRSLAPREAEYNSEHIYHLEGAPHGTMAKGDVMIWTSGTLADLYRRTERYQALADLTLALAGQINRRGVMGTLGEAQDAEGSEMEANLTGSPVFAASLAEFIRLSVDDFMGIIPEHGRMLRFAPKIPFDWGDYRMESDFRGGRVWLERLSGMRWQVGQEGIEPDLQAVLDVEPSPGERAQHSLRLLPGETVTIVFFQLDEGIWQGKLEGI